MKEDKIRYRAYKKGKFWMFAAIVTSSALFAFGGRAYADTSANTENHISVTAEDQPQATAETPLTTAPETGLTSEANTAATSQPEQITAAETADENTDKTVISETEANLQSTPAAETAENSDTDTKTSWSFNSSSDENTAAELTKTGTLEGTSGNYAGIVIDTSQTGAKFAPRQTDTQINTGTKLSIPVANAPYGAEVTLVLAGGTTSLHTQLGSIVNSGSPVVIALPNGTAAGYFDLIFDQTSYLSQIKIQYKDAPVDFPGTPQNLKAEDTTWDLANSERPNAQGDKDQVFQGIKIDASQAGAKFTPRSGDTQVNAGTVLYIPIAANQYGTTLSFSLSGGTTSLHTDSDQLSNVSGTAVLNVPASDKAYYLAVTFDQTTYLNQILLSYGKAPIVFPGTPENTKAEDTTWDLANSERPNAQGDKDQAFQGIKIDASQAGAKFTPRSGDTQINAGTVLYIPIAANQYGTSLSFSLSGGTTSLHTDSDSLSNVSGSAVLNVPASDETYYLAVTFDQTTYLNQIQLSYDKAPIAFPGIPENTKAEDTTWDLANSERPNAQGDKDQAFQGIKIDASQAGAKFTPRSGDTQINAGTVLYIPIAANQYGTSLSFSLSGGTTSLHTDSDSLSNVSGTAILSVPASDKAYYLAVTFDQTTYLNQILLSYDKAPIAFPGIPENTKAEDTTWDLTATGGQRPNAQGDKDQNFQGLKIDASKGKFSPRDTDTQVNAGTVLYIPVVADAAGATLSIKGNNYNNLTITLDGQEVQLGSDIIINTETTRYIPLAFSSKDGSGSAYLTSIDLDYASDNTVTSHTVTVGKNGQYQSIQAALDNNKSSLKDRLILEIEPGEYREKVTVNLPGVTFKNADSTGKNKVIIRASYYSSNNFDANGVFHPKDAYDLGTDQSATVIINASGTGFSAYGITFQNDYNITDHLGENEQTPAVAFNSKADKITIHDSSFIGRQDTLYLQGDGNRVVIVNSYIEGTVDFIFGNADAYIKDSYIYMTYFPGRKSGYFTAPNTAKGYTGLVFDNSTFGVSEDYPSKSNIYLARPWQTEIATQTKRSSNGSTKLISYDQNAKNPTYLNTSSATTIINSKVSERVSDQRFSPWTRKDNKGRLIDVTYHPDVRFVEFNSQTLHGEAVTPHEIKLGQMLTGDSQAYRQQLLQQMKIGNQVGSWDADLASYGQGNIRVVYLDETSNRILETQELSGDYGSQETYQTADTIQNYQSQGYVLVNDAYPSQGLIYSRANKGLTYEVRFQHATSTVSEEKAVLQTIHYLYENGEKALEDHVNSLSFSRTVTTDQVTKEITRGTWQALNGNTFEAVTSPIIIGYTASEKQINRMKSITADSANVEVTVTYLPNTVRARVTFIDDTSNKVLTTQKLSGKFATKAAYQTNDTIQKYIAKGYMLVSDNYPTEGLIYRQENASYEVHLAHSYTTSDETKTVTQTIRYLDEKGKKAADDHVATLTFKRTATRDNVTKKVTYGDWIAVNGNRFNAVDSPRIIGYTPQQSQIKPVENVTANTANITIKVTYTANTQEAKIYYIDDQTHKVVLTKTLTGKFKTKNSYRTATDIKTLKKQGYIMVSDNYPKNGIIYDQPDVVKEYEVHLKHGTITVSAKKPGKPGSPLSAGSQVKWPAGTDKNSLTKTVTRTIEYRYSDGRQAAKSKIETITFNRELVLDSVTGQIIEDKGWKASKNGASFKSVTSPKIKGYSTDTKTVQPLPNITATTDNITQTVIYTEVPKAPKTPKTSKTKKSKQAKKVKKKK